MKDIIRIENLIFIYLNEQEDTQEKALDNVNLKIEEGSFTVILGKNGSGKSTLAKNMNALLLPTDGDIYVSGFNTKDEAHLWDIRQSAGMVFQNPDNQIVSAIVEDDVAFGPENLGIDPKIIRERVDRSLDSVNMGEYKKKAPHLLSGGQKQRVAIAGAVAMKPKCIIFDEPTAMLDPKGRKEVINIIKDLNKEGITGILITHFMEEAAEADRVIIMEEGQVKLDGSPREVFKQREKLKEMDLDVPMVSELSYRLKNKGIEISQDIINEKEFIEAICQLK